VHQRKHPPPPPPSPRAIARSLAPPTTQTQNNNSTEPIQERELESPRGGDAEVTSLLDALKRHFRAASPQKTDAQKAAQKAALLQRLNQQQQQEQGGGGGDSATLSPQVRDLLDRVVDGDLLGGGMVENIALLSNAPETGFVAVNLYCDDEAALKNLPSNARASSLAMECGKPLDVKGDAFLARVFDNEDEFKRLDFPISDVSSGAGWVKEAARQAERRRERERAGAGGSDPSSFLAGLKKQAGGAAQKQQQQRPQQRNSNHPSDAERDRGNARFKQGDWDGAAAHYTSALKLADAVVPGADKGEGKPLSEQEQRRLRLAALGNRAMAYLKMERWADAAADATGVIDAAAAAAAGEDSGSKDSKAAVVKARLRRSAALKEMGDVSKAKADLEAVLEVEPSSKEAAEALAALGGGGGGGEK
jgi:tetratricopeptide (TPR) repeat protein